MKNIKLLKRLTEIQLKNNDDCIIVRGISMQPLIRDGDLVRIERCNCYQSGDIVVALDLLGRLLIHRVIDVKHGSLLIKGDNAVAAEKVRKEHCFGRVVEIRTNEGRKFKIKNSAKNRIIAVLSKRMHKKWTKYANYDKSMKSMEHKMMKILAKIQI